MPTVTQDLEYIRSAVDTLEEYLLSDQVYWPLDRSSVQFGSTNPTRLSLGGLLLALARAKARPQGPEGGQELARFTDRVDTLHHQWRTHWEGKAAQEFSVRLNQWQNKVRDLVSEQDEEVKGYARDVYLRAMIELLRQNAGQSVPPHEQSRLDTLDMRLNSRWREADFLWEPELEESFPRADYWFLYGHPGLAS